MKTKLYVKLAGLIAAMQACEKVTGDDEAMTRAESWARIHRATVKDLCAANLPSGSGFDNGSHISFEASTPEKLIFTTDFHHMYDNGSYRGWTTHTITVRPSLSCGILLTISGKNKNDIKELIHQAFDIALHMEVV